MDERRRRRLAANGDGAESSEPGEEKSLPECVPAELCAASPWIPLARWKLWTISGLLLTGVSAVLFMAHQTPTFRPELEPALIPLFRGDDPKLISYLETIFWTLSGQLALLVGWHRSRSRLDFRGRYRVWPWAAAAMFFCGLCVATRLHLGLGTVLDQLPALEQVRPRLGWMAPALALLLPLWMLLDRDVRRSTASVVLLRAAMLTLTAGATLTTYSPAWIDKALLPFVLHACGLLGSALLMLAMWVQGWYVAYVTPDPPAPSTFRWPTLRWNPLRWLLNMILALFRRRIVVEEPAPRKRKKSEEGAAPKRKRKTKRTRRSRPKVVEEEAEEAAEDEDYEEEAAEDSDEESESAEDDLTEEEEEELTRPDPAPAPTFAKQPQPSPYRQQDSRTAQAPATKSHQYADDDEDEDDDQGEAHWRIDGPSPEQLKGLSKKQRRALIKQHREQQRNQR